MSKDKQRNGGYEVIKEMTLEEIKAMWGKDITESTKSLDELKEKVANGLISKEAYEADKKALDERLDGLKAALDGIEKALTAKKGYDKDEAEEGKGGFKSFGEFIHNVKGAIIDRDNESVKRLKSNNERMFTKAPTSSTSQSAITGSEGRFLVPETFSAQLLGDMNQYGKILSRCFQLPVSGQIVKIPALVDYDHSSQTYYSAVSVARSSERTQISGAAMDFGQVELKLNKLVGLAGITSELVRWSAISVEPIIRRVFASAMAAKIERELIRGTGAGEMMGVLTSPCRLPVAIETGQTATLEPENITHMMEGLPLEAKSPSWTIHPKMLTPLMLLNKAIGTGGDLLPWFLMGNQTLVGYPVDKSEFCVAPDSEGDIILADWSQYIYAYEAGGGETMVSPHFWFDYDADAIRFTMYNDGQFWWKSSRKLDDGASYVSPCITLAGSR